MLDIVVYGNGEGVFVGIEVAEAVGEYHLLAGLVLDCVVVFLHAK